MTNPYLVEAGNLETDQGCKENLRWMAVETKQRSPDILINIFDCYRCLHQNKEPADIYNYTLNHLLGMKEKKQ